MNVQEIGNGIFCIDTGLYRHGLAASYLIREGDELAFVDTGATQAVPVLLGLIKQLGLTPEQVQYIVPTHVHLDHAGGVGALMACCPNAQLVVHPRGAPHLIDPSRLMAGATAVYGAATFEKDFGLLTPVPAARVILAEDGLIINLGTRRLLCLDTPGHANHHACIFDTQTQGIFTGDTFGIAYLELSSVNGRYLFAPTTPVAFDPDAWINTLDRLMALRPQVVYLTHYGPLTHPERHLNTLQTSIRRLADLALAEEAIGIADGRPERLRQNVANVLVNEALIHGCDLDAAAIRNLLTMDADLNAQGLEIWLRRRATTAK